MLPAPNPEQDFHEQHRDYLRIRDAIRFIADQHASQPSLADIAHHLGLSAHHVQRLFTRWAGVSPKQFLQYLTKAYAKQMLREQSLEQTSLSLGLSGTSRLHDLMVTCEAMTPGEYKQGGHGLHIHWGLQPTPFGLALLGTTHRGVCHLALLDDEEELDAALGTLRAEWPSAQVVQDQSTTARWSAHIFGALTHGHPLEQPLPLLLKGSPFQLKVWEALLRIPAGQVQAYQGVAAACGEAHATRAVASAIARNKIALLIPCHRVIRSTGDINAYRWGSDRKRALLAWEAAQKSIA